jgi:peptidyl-prolyl cis-trans isomerase C
MFDRDITFRRYLTVTLFVFLLSPLHIMAAEAPDTADVRNHVIAVVNGKELTLEDFNAFISTRIGERQTSLNAQQINALFSEYINRELVYQDAVKKGWDEAPEVVSAVENHRRNIVARYAFNQLLQNPVAQDEIEKAYRELKPVREYRLSHILTPDESTAREVIGALGAGKPFADLAREKSIDSTAAQGGEIGWISADQLSPALRDAAASLRPGGYAREPVKTEFGWHVLRLDESRIVPVPPIEEVRDDLRRQLANRNIARYISELREAGKIEIRQ